MSTWMFTQGRARDDRPFYVVDLPGHGGSGKELGAARAKSLPDTVIDYLNATASARPISSAISLGGAIATTIALKDPDRVAALTLVLLPGFGRRSAGEFIKASSPRAGREAQAVSSRLLVANRNLVTSDMVEEVLKVQAPRRRRGGAPRDCRREFCRRCSAGLAPVTGSAR